MNPSLILFYLAFVKFSEDWTFLSRETQLNCAILGNLQRGRKEREIKMRMISVLRTTRWNIIEWLMIVVEQIVSQDSFESLTVRSEF